MNLPLRKTIIALNLVLLWVAVRNSVRQPAFLPVVPGGEATVSPRNFCRVMPATLCNDVVLAGTAGAANNVTVQRAPQPVTGPTGEDAATPYGPETTVAAAPEDGLPEQTSTTGGRTDDLIVLSAYDVVPNDDQSNLFVEDQPEPLDEEDPPESASSSDTLGADLVPASIATAGFPDEPLALQAGPTLRGQSLDTIELAWRLLAQRALRDTNAAIQLLTQARLREIPDAAWSAIANTLVAESIQGGFLVLASEELRAAWSEAERSRRLDLLETLLAVSPNAAVRQALLTAAAAWLEQIFRDQT